MSSDTLEGILFSLQSNAEFAARFRADPDAALKGYPLSAQERRDLLAWNVRAMSEIGVSDMLLMLGHNAVLGPQAMPEYLRKMNAPAGSTASAAG